MRRSALTRAATFLAPAALAALVWGAAGDASAAPAVTGGEGKRFRLHGELDFLSFYHFNPDGAGTTVNGGGFGIGRTTLGDAGIGPFGLGLVPRPLWSLGFGVLLLQSRMNIGGKISFAIDSARFEDETDPTMDLNVTLVSGIFTPYFRWIFLPGKRFRPFAEFHFGLGGGSVITRVDDSDTRSVASGIWPQVGAVGGVHIFIIDAFSVDLGLGFDYFAPHSKTKTETPAGTMDEDYDKDGDVINLAVTSGLSVWF